MNSYNNWCYGYTMSNNPTSAASGYNSGSSNNNSSAYGYPQHKPPLPHQPAASAKLHTFAQQNSLWESYSSVSQGSGFLVTLTLGNEQFMGNGTTLKEAKEAAAARALRETSYTKSNNHIPTPLAPPQQLQTQQHPPTAYPPATVLASPPAPPNPATNSTSQLHEIATKKGVSVEFKFTEPYNFKFKSSMRTWAKADILSHYKVTLKVASYDFYGEADHPQKAKHVAANEALPYVRSLPDIPKAQSTVPEGMLEGKNVIMALNEISMTNGLCPEWNMVGDSGLPHQRSFTWSLKLGDAHEAVGTGSSKKIAKTNAAVQMLSIIPEEWKKAVLEVDGKKKKKAKKRKPGKEKDTKEEEKVEIGPTSLPKKVKVDDKGSNGEEVKSGGGGLDASVPIYEQITSSSPISCLYEYCKKAKINDPFFECVDENVIDTWQNKNQTLKKTEYTMKLIVKDKTYYDSGPNKRLAKNSVASKAWNNIRAGID